MEIVWSPLAVDSLTAVIEYVTDNFGPAVAQKTAERILSKINKLADYPEIGVPDFELSRYRGVTVRHLVMPPNLVYYMIDKDVVVIVVVVHSKQSPQTIRKLVNDAIGRK